MNREFYFADARWVGDPARTVDTFSVLRGHFSVGTVRSAQISVIGLGFFKCYINGICVNPDTFLPLSSDFEASCDPEEEVLTGHRIYVPQFDITPFVHAGENTVAVHFGGGWYTHKNRPFGLPKAIYHITAEENGGTKHFVSDENCRIGRSYVESYAFVQYETHSNPALSACFGEDFDDSAWSHAAVTEQPETEYCVTDCPADALIETLPVTPCARNANGTVYDCGQNTTGYPVLRLHAGEEGRVAVRLAEAVLPDGTLDPKHTHNQRYEVTADGTAQTAQPEFTWFGFRYFEVTGPAEPLCVKVIHANIASASTFDSDNETLNWTYKTFLHTMLCNMHTGHPSDCPHIERRGYTGDGQLTCHAALSVLDARSFYEKWMQDIGDCQDVLSGHVQYTAPYIRSGGGPGGWGSAIVEVPYQLYMHYGDRAILEKYYAQMRRYIDFLEAHSEFGLVTSDKKGDWCLGDWCGPIILYPGKNISSTPRQQMLLPPPMVNTYFMVKSLVRLCEIARIIGREEDIPAYEEKADLHKRAIQAAYYTQFDNSFLMNAQGANAYAVDLGLGGEKTYSGLVQYYQNLGHYDTGIFATDILTRVLFERGDSELAFTLLTGSGPLGFDRWRKNGATTLHEYWDSDLSRSHSHPMFGAPVAYFFEYLLGITQKAGTAGYSSLVIAPQIVSGCARMSGSMKTPNGTVAVAYVKENGRIRFRITVPAGSEAVFRYAGQEYALAAGENEREFALS